MDKAPVTLHWGIIYYIRQIAPPGIVQGSGSKNGQGSWEEAFEWRDQGGLRLGFHSGDTVFDSDLWD